MTNSTPEQSTVPNFLAGTGKPLNALLLGMPPGKSQARFRRLWKPGATLPNAPDGYVFPVAAFNKVGCALAREEWTGYEFVIGTLDWTSLLELPSTAFSPTGERNDEHAFLEANYHAARSVLKELGKKVPTYTAKFRQSDYEEVRALGLACRDDWARAREYRDLILNSLCAAAASGELKTVIRPKGSGHERPMDVRWWKTDDYVRRITPCSINPDFPDDDLAEKTHWFYIEEAGLNLIIEKLTRQDAPSQDPALPPVSTSPPLVRTPPASGTLTAFKSPGRKRGRKENTVWGKAYAKGYKVFRVLALSYSDEAFRTWIIKMNPSQGDKASPKHHSVIARYREKAERGGFDYLLDK